MGKIKRGACLGENLEFGVGYVEFEIPSKPPSGNVQHAVGYMCLELGRQVRSEESK